ncbi:MAG: cytochrome c biogenesis protein CcsA, partial [Planctomycetes bacterium]|nr:cytochrome c biogenesis protein CcsA [Planctomycetota bacterium]
MTRRDQDRAVLVREAVADRRRRLPSRPLWALLTLLCSFTPGAAQQTERTGPWPAEVLEAVSRIPVQEGGRVKPLATLARFQLMRLVGTHGCTTPRGERLGPVAWLLDCLCFPEQAQHYAVIRVDDAQVVESLGLSIAGKRRRDRYSYAELLPAFAKLGRQALRFEQTPREQRTALESQVIRLAQVMPQLRDLLHTFDFALEQWSIDRSPALTKLFPGRDRVSFLEVIERFAAVRALLQQGDHEPRLLQIASSLSESMQLGRSLRFLPPVLPGGERYLSATEAIQDGPSGWHRTVLLQIEAALRNRSDLATLGQSLTELQRTLREPAAARTALRAIDGEVAFYRADLFGKALWTFLCGFLSCCILWLRPGSRWLRGASALLATGGAALLVAGIVTRCVLRGRPPVTTPYEVILLVVAVGVLLLLVVELTRRTGVWTSLANPFGALGMWLAVWHETSEGTDTMQQLVAVLDTNFWLATHVTTITLGYCAGTLAALIAHVYLLGKLFGLRRGDPTFYTELSHTIYGVLSFGLVFATVGTILGGVWANDSWGRFWGWD